MLKSNFTLTDAIIRQVGKLLRAGNYQQTVQGYIGVSHTSWYNWIKRGNAAIDAVIENPEAPLDWRDALCIRFVREIAQAEADSVIVDLSTIRAASKKNWQAAAWILERRHPDMFAQKQQLTVKEDKESISIDEVKEKLKQIKDKSQ